MNFIFFLSKGCGGKDTQGDKLIEFLNKRGIGTAKLSTGDIFRCVIKELKSGNRGENSYLSKLLNVFEESYLREHLQNINTGKQAPDDIVNFITEMALNELPDGTETVISTGYPRTVGQYEMLRRIAENHNAIVSGINLTVSDETVRERAANRFEKYGRVDDSPEIVEIRLNQFEEFQSGLIDLLSATGRIEVIDGEAPINEVFCMVLGSLPKELTEQKFNTEGQLLRNKER